ncbi:unnamed protein product [marine sediment metagenome]|uniref:Uncharacterized protein n=1 Tax=marine sediment metagenome TaxID=412755 RepID=X1SJ11_9ZZZZ
MIEDFTTYEKYDPNSRIEVTPSRVTWTDLQLNEDARVSFDKGEAHFNGDFEHLLTVKMTGGTSDAKSFCWALTNVVDDMYSIRIGGGSYLGLFFYKSPTATHELYLEECDNGERHQSNFVGALNTVYYLKIVRDESFGTYGKLSCFIYSDAARTNLLNTIYMSLRTSKKDFQHIFGVNSYNAAVGGYQTSGYSENLDLSEEAPPPEAPEEAMGKVRGLDFRGKGFRP